MIYIVAYDIANNRRRLKVAKILESWGYRIQESGSSQTRVGGGGGASVSG